MTVARQVTAEVRIARVLMVTRANLERSDATGVTGGTTIRKIFSYSTGMKKGHGL